jgi:hypothetical protein
MGFYTELIFNDIELDGKRLHELQASARRAIGDPDCSWSYMLENVYIESSSYEDIDLELSDDLPKRLKKTFKSTLKPLSRYKVTLDENGDTEHFYYIRWWPEDVHGKWYDVEPFVAWLCEFCTGSGQLFQITQEETGGLWGWEFDGQGRYRELELRSKGRWKRSGGAA